MVTVGIHVRENPAALAETLASLVRCSPDAGVVIVPDHPGPDVAEALGALNQCRQLTEGAAGAAAAFNRLAASTAARVVVMLESGSLVTAGWLDRLRAAFEHDSRAGLAGPSTNLSWNPHEGRSYAGITELVTYPPLPAEWRFPHLADIGVPASPPARGRR